MPDGAVQVSSASESMQDGRVLVGSGGLLATADECCDVPPCGCPGVPPLLASYSVTWTGSSGPAKCSQCENDTETPPVTVTHFGNCVWTYQTAAWNGYTEDPVVGVNLHLITGSTPQKWEMDIYCRKSGGTAYVVWTGSKTTGATPVGTYVEDSKCETTNIASVVVS